MTIPRSTYVLRVCSSCKNLKHIDTCFNWIDNLMIKKIISKEEWSHSSSYLKGMEHMLFNLYYKEN